jgi:hypothetical protein
VAGVAHREDRASERLHLELLDRLARHRVGTLDEPAGELGHLPCALGLDSGGVYQTTRGIEYDGRQDVRRALDESRGDHRGHNSRVPLPRISWMVTVALCIVAAVLLLVSGYSGYAAILVAIGAAAAVNLL